MATRLVERRASGFTLIEAVVALVIVAFGMMALYMQLNQYAITATYMEEKTLASWIATNRLTELSIDPSWPEVGTGEDDVEFAGRDWHYTVEVSETQVASLRRVDVSVALADDPERIIHKVSTLVEPPPPAGFIPPRWIGGPGGFGG